MKKCVLYTTLSALLFTIIGAVAAFIGDPSLFVEAYQRLVSVLPANWYVLIPPVLAILFIIINIIGKGIRKVKRVDAPLVLLLATFAYLLVAPRALSELLARTSPPQSLIFTTGAALIALSFFVLLVLTFVDTFGKKKAKAEPAPAAEEKPAEEKHEEPAVEEIVEEEEKVSAPVEYLDEEVEDEEDLEVETEEEAKVRKEENKKAARAKKAAAPKKEAKAEPAPVKKDDKDKDYDRIYHIMKRAKDDRWIVKIAQSRKAIKIFDTQKEAIAYAEVLASNNNGVVRIFASKGANKGRIIV
ncbi:MAG: DUF2188 domain-containing protein [Bacteroidales bacterium]